MNPNKQGVGQFDGGKIVEQKPIGFPGEGSEVSRIGPLFYWAWFYSEKEGFIPPHPHQGFEIITYVVNGKAEHGDSLGTKSTVGPGGLQLMQTGSGVHHQEGFIGPEMEGFQIWFEPNFREALRRTPAYHQFEKTSFKKEETDGVRVKTVIGGTSPVELVADVEMWDVQLEEGTKWTKPVDAGYTLAALAIRGNGKWNDETFQEKDFVTIEAEESGKASLTATSPLRMILIKVPTETDYRLLPKR